MGGGSLECEPVTVNSESANNAVGEIGEVRMLAEFFARTHIRQMDFNECYLRREECIANRDAGVGIGRRVDDDEVDLVGPGLLDAIDDVALAVRLEGLQRDTLLLCKSNQIQVDLGERIGTIDFRLARAEQVQIGAMYDQNLSHLIFLRA
jgi:hypothetical protein